MEKTNEKLLISLIIPVYNAKPFLAELLDSVINQSYKNLEVILIDDGSTDGSGEMCDEYASSDKRLAVIHQKNMGLSAARNIGLARMNGEMVAFIDADDVLHPDYVSSMLGAVMQSGADLVICRYSIYYNGSKKGKYPALQQGLYNNVDSLRYIVDDQINGSVWNKLYRSELWKDIRFPDGQVYEDAITILWIFFHCKNVYVLDKNLYLYRRHSGSITRTKTKKNVIDKINASFQICTFVKEHTPEIFSQKQLTHVQQNQLKDMIREYVYYFICSHDTDIGFSKDVRDIIISTGAEYGMKKYCLPVRIRFFLLRFFPYILVYAYRIYNKIANLNSGIM